MKIVIKNIEDEANDFLVYLKTDDDVNVSAQFACEDSLKHIIEDLIDESGEEEENVEVDYPELRDIRLEKMNEYIVELEKVKDMEKKLPLVLVFYLDRGLMENRQIINPFAEAVNEAIVEKDANVMAFFLPTDGEERIECINPLIATPEEKSKISRLIKDISKSFDINQLSNED